MNWTLKNLQDKDIAQVGGTYKKLAPVKVARIKKLPNLLERALQQVEPGDSVIGDCGATIFIKPMSANRAYKGKIFKTDYHKNYINAVTLLLPNNIVIPDGFLKVTYELGFSSHGSDLDNPLKTLTDILAAKYRFNDNKIMMATVFKKIVKKGKEFISFKIEKFNRNGNIITNK